MAAAAKGADRVAKFINKRVDELVSRKSQKQIAAEAGYANPNMITMLKQGQTKLALDRVPAMARALEVDPVELFRMALSQFFEGKPLQEINSMITSAVTKNELEILEIVREATDGLNPKLNNIQKEKIREIF